VDIPHLPAVYVFSEQDLIVKPSTMKKFLEFIGGSDQWTDKPTILKAYSAILQLANELKQAMRNMNPQDMVDIQSTFWIVASPKSLMCYPRVKEKRIFQAFPGIYQTYPLKRRSGAYSFL
jgi:hypothetical protein